jgi:translation elongation factor EF-1alpha
MLPPLLLEKFERQASELGRASFKYAWIMDR